MVRLLFAGYLGCGNLGDDALMVALAKRLSSDYSVSVLSGSPEETYRTYGFSAVPRKDIGRVNAAIQACDALVFPGGSIFQDASSARSVAYYAALVRKAKAANKKVLLLAQGIGPLTTFLGKRAAVAAFNSADVLTVRDPQSLQTLQQLGVKTQARLTADMALLLPPPEEVGKTYKVGDLKTIGIAPRPHGKSNREVVDLFGGFAQQLFNAGMMPVLIEMDREEDGPLLLQISKKHGGGKIPDIRKLTTPEQLQERIARMDAVVGMRLHAGVLATTVGVPPLMVSYDPKVAAFAKLLEIDAPALQFEGLTPHRLYESFMRFFEHRDRNVKILERKRDELRKQAEINLELLENCFLSAVRSTKL